LFATAAGDLNRFASVALRRIIWSTLGEKQRAGLILQASREETMSQTMYHFHDPQDYLDRLAETWRQQYQPMDYQEITRKLANIHRQIHNTEGRIQAENREQLETYAAKAIDDSVTGFTRAGLAFQQGNDAVGGVEIARSLSSVFVTASSFTRFAKAGGPVGIILSAMGEALSIVAFFLDTFVVKKAEDREKTLLSNIETMILTVYAHEIEDHLKATIEALQTGGNDLAKRAAKYPGALKEWRQVVEICPTLGGTDAFIQLIATEGWLVREETQRLPDWGNVFEAYCCATGRQAENYFNGLLALKTSLTEEEWEDRNTTEMEALAQTVDLERETAMNYITGYVNNRQAFISKIRPVMANNVNTWRVGAKRQLYFRRPTFESDETSWKTVGGGRSTFNYLDGHNALALGPGDRIWGRADSARLYTRTPDEPDDKLTEVSTDLAEGVADFCVVSEDRTGDSGGQISTVYYIHGQLIVWFEWDEAKKSGDLKNKSTFQIGGTPRAIAATKGGRFYVISNNPNSLIEYARGDALPTLYDTSRDMFENARLAANRENLFVYNIGPRDSSKILVFPHVFPHGTVRDLKRDPNLPEVLNVTRAALTPFSARRDASQPYHIPPPSGAEFSLPNGWAYDSLFASDDRSILAIIDWKFYRWIDGKWSFEPGQPGSRHRVCTRPVRGYEEFLELQDMFSDLVKNASRG
jgi:hypothetical protein